MKKWVKNIKSVIDSNNAGECPFCLSKNTGYLAKKTMGDMGYVDIWCNDCKKAVHISRMNIHGIEIGESNVPKGLIF